jgi:hypothetical protein
MASIDIIIPSPGSNSQGFIRTYRSYVSNLEQTTGTGAPVATVFENSLASAVNWQRGSAGSYFLVGTAGAFPLDKTICFINNTASNVDRTWVYPTTFSISEDAIEVDVEFGGVNVDEKLLASIIIWVYN